MSEYVSKHGKNIGEKTLESCQPQNTTLTEAEELTLSSEGVQVS